MRFFSRHLAVRILGPRNRVQQLALGLLELGDVGHHGHGAAVAGAAPRDPVDAAVRRAVLERLAGRIAQALDAARDMGVDVAVAVVAVLGEIAQQRRIGLARLEQLAAAPGTTRRSGRLQTTMSRSWSV